MKNVAGAGADVPERRWPARYTVIGLSVLAAFVCYIDRVNISVAVLAMQQSFGWTETDKGWVLSSFFVGYLLFQVPSGWLANRLGGRLILGLAVLWWSISTILTPLAAHVSLGVLLATRIAMGLGEAATFPAAYNLFGRWVPAAERSRAAALLLSGGPLGTLFALTTTGWIVTALGWPSVFYLFGAVGLLFVLIWFLNVRDDPAGDPRVGWRERALLAREAAGGAPAGTVPWGRLLRAPAVWALIVNHFCSNWSLYVLLSWLPTYFARSRGVGIVDAGLMSAAPWLSMFVMSNVAAWLADGLIRRGLSVTAVRKIMQTVGLLGSAACLLLVGQAGSPEAAVVVMCGALGALGFTWAGFAPNHLDIAPRYADVLMGVTNTAGTIPGVVGVAVTGWLVDVTGSFDAAFLLAGGISVAGVAVWLAFGTGRQICD